MGSFRQPLSCIGTPDASPNVERFAPIVPLPLLLVFILLPQPMLAQKPARARAKGAGNNATIKTTVRQVLLDVVVTDRKNHPVKGLRPEEFAILENDVPQQILSFETHNEAMASTSLDVRLP